VAEMGPRCGRDVADILPKCSRDVAEMLKSAPAAHVDLSTTAPSGRQSERARSRPVGEPTHCFICRRLREGSRSPAGRGRWAGLLNSPLLSPRAKPARHSGAGTHTPARRWRETQRLGRRVAAMITAARDRRRPRRQRRWVRVPLGGRGWVGVPWG